MTAITYTAKRNMQPTGISVVSDANISVSLVNSPEVAAFNSTNSPATDLSVFTDTYSVLSSGFTNTENNGWFFIDAVPTLQQIVTNAVGSGVVVEAAGQSVTLTEYYRTVGTSYDLETSGMMGTVISDAGLSKESISLSGARETLFTRRKETYTIRTGVIPSTDFLQWREFFASVMGGETFTLDPYGSMAVPDNVQTVYLSGQPGYSRIDNFNKYFITFKVEVA